MKKVIIVSSMVIGLLAIVLVVSYLFEDKIDPGPDFTEEPNTTQEPRPEDICECALCDVCRGCLVLERLCECFRCPGSCTCPLDAGFDIELPIEWDGSQNEGVLTAFRYKDDENPLAILRVFAMTIGEIINVIGIEDYNISDYDELTFDEFLKQSGKSYEEFNEDFVKSGMAEGTEIISIDKKKIAKKTAFETRIEYNMESEDSQDNEGLNIICVVFDESKIYTIGYNGVNNSDYIKEFEKMIKTFEIKN